MAHRKFNTGAVRASAKGKPNPSFYSDPLVELRFNRYMMKAEKKYGRGNWKKGIPLEEYLQSMMRHALKLWIELEYAGEIPGDWQGKWGGKLEEWLGPLKDIEIGYDHASGIRFNVNGIMREEIRRELLRVHGRKNVMGYCEHGVHWRSCKKAKCAGKVL